MPKNATTLTAFGIEEPRMNKTRKKGKLADQTFKLLQKKKIE